MCVKFLSRHIFATEVLITCAVFSNVSSISRRYHIVYFSKWRISKVGFKIPFQEVIIKTCKEPELQGVVPLPRHEWLGACPGLPCTSTTQLQLECLLPSLQHLLLRTQVVVGQWSANTPTPYVYMSGTIHLHCLMVTDDIGPPGWEECPDQEPFWLPGWKECQHGLHHLRWPPAPCN